MTPTSYHRYHLRPDEGGNAHTGNYHLDVVTAVEVVARKGPKFRHFYHFYHLYYLLFKYDGGGEFQDYVRNVSAGGGGGGGGSHERSLRLNQRHRRDAHAHAPSLKRVS